MPNQFTITGILLDSRGALPCRSIGHLLLTVTALSPPVQVDGRGAISCMLFRGELMLPFIVCLISKQSPYHLVSGNADCSKGEYEGVLTGGMCALQ
jgi:hypothetical protein